MSPLSSQAVVPYFINITQRGKLSFRFSPLPMAGCSLAVLSRPTFRGACVFVFFCSMQVLNARDPKIVNGPEVLDKYVGGSEEKIRALFADAEKEQVCSCHKMSHSLLPHTVTK